MSGHGRQTNSRLVTSCVAVLLATLVASAPSSGQSTTTSGLDGRIVDSSGAAMPGVTVTVSSPALQMPQRVTISDEHGRYRFSQLPAGVYDVMYELPGFSTIQRTAVQIGVGAVATLDIQMAVGSLEESITVTGNSPVVDIRTATVATNVTTQMLETLPTSRSIPEAIKLTPGITITGVPDVGGSRTGDHENYRNYGSGNSGNWMTIDGVMTLGAFNYYDMGSLAEARIRAVGNDAEIPTSGVNFSAIVKSGGNQFHGSAMGQWQGEALQSENIDDALKAQGVTRGNSIERYYDSNVDLGGKLIHDRLWFYGGGHWQGRRNHLIGYSAAPGPDGRFFTADDDSALERLTISNYIIKLSGQLSSRQRLEGFYDYNNKDTPDNGASAFRPRPSTTHYTLPAHTGKVEWTFTPTNRSILNALVAKTGWLVGYTPYTDAPSEYDYVTQRYSGVYQSGPTLGDNAAPSTAPSDNTQVRIGYSYHKPDFFGDHDIRIGFDAESTYYNKASFLRDAGTGGLGNDYALYYNNGIPLEVRLYNTPVDTQNSMDNQSLFIKDTLRLGDRLTLNLGVRLEHVHAYYPPQSKPAGTFSAAAEYPKIDVYDWWAVAPRAGVSVRAYRRQQDGSQVDIRALQLL